MYTSNGAAERRPSVKSTTGGKPYLLVHTKRGIRTRQITQTGWNWVRVKYPSNLYPTPDDIPLTYDDYREMHSRRFIATGETQRPVATDSRPYMSYSGEKLTTVFMEHRSDAVVLRQLKRELQHRRVPSMQRLRDEVEAALRRQYGSAPSGGTSRSNNPPVECRHCSAAQRESARFCPACGTMRHRFDWSPAVDQAMPRASAATRPPVTDPGPFAALFGTLCAVALGAIVLAWKLSWP